MVLGQPVGGQHEREPLVAGRVVGVVGALEDLARRVGALRVQRVVERRLVRLVVRGKRPVDQPGLRVDPAQPVGVQDERVVAGDRGHAGVLAGRLVVRRLVGLEVGVVPQPRPLALLGVPPDVLLALRPRLAVGIGGRAVVEDAAIGGPRPPPLRGDPVLLGARVAAGRLVDAVGVDAGVDPRAARGRAVVGEVLVLGDERAVGLATVDLAQNGVGVRLVVLADERVVPDEVEDRAVLGIIGTGEPLADLAEQVVGEPGLRAAVTRRLDRLVVVLQQALGVGEAAVLLDV